MSESHLAGPRETSPRPGPAIDRSEHDGVVVARITARFDRSSAGRLRDQLLGTAAGAERALVIDISTLGIDPDTPLSMFVAVWSRVTTWPGVPVLLVTQAEPALARLGAGPASGRLPVLATLGDALRRAEQEPAHPRARLSLGCDPFSPRRARVWLREQLDLWKIPDPAAAELVCTELVDNAIIHARSESVVRLDRRPAGVAIAVEDSSPSPPRLLPLDQRRHSGRGLVIVDQLCRAWGSSPRSADQPGKIVWAVLHGHDS